MSELAKDVVILSASSGVSTMLMGGLEYGAGTIMQNELAETSAANTDYNQLLDTANALANTGPWLALGGAILTLASGSIFYWRYLREPKQQ